MGDSVKEKVDKITTINFSITKCPHNVYKDFTGYCKDETNDNYSFGLKMLLESRKANAKEAVLFQQYMELKDEVVRLRERVVTLEGKPEEPAEKRKIKTMGSGENG